MIGYFANLAIPRIGEISRCVALKKAEDVPFDKLIGTVIIERISDVIMLMISILLVLLIEYHRLGSFLNEHFFSPMMESFHNSALTLLIAAIIITGCLFLSYHYIKKNKNNVFIKKIKTLTGGIIDGLKTILTMKSRAAFVLHTLFIWLMYFCNDVCIVFSIAIHITVRYESRFICNGDWRNCNDRTCTRWNWCLSFFSFTRAIAIWYSRIKRNCVCYFSAYLATHCKRIIRINCLVRIICFPEKEIT